MKETLCNLLDNPPRDPLGYINTGILADHLLDNGVLVPKYKIGQVFWWSSAIYDKTIRLKLKSIRYGQEGFVYLMETENKERVGFVDDDFGTRVHLFEDEARKIIRQRWKEERERKDAQTN